MKYATIYTNHGRYTITAQSATLLKSELSKAINDLHAYNVFINAVQFLNRKGIEALDEMCKYPNDDNGFIRYYNN